MANKKRILVVEDHEPMLGAIESVLKLRRYTVSTALNGFDALQMMEEMQPDLLIVDIPVAEMDEYTRYREVQERAEWQSTLLSS